MMFSRNLTHLGENAFHPAGATAVRVRFTMAAEKVTEVAVFDPGLVVAARRVSKRLLPVRSRIIAAWAGKSRSKTSRLASSKSS